MKNISHLYPIEPKKFYKIGYMKRSRYGIGSLRRKNNGSTWYCRFYFQGKQIEESTGTTERIEAEKFLQSKVSGSYIPSGAPAATREQKKQSIRNIGTIAEKIVEIDLLSRGFFTFLSSTPNSPCDLIFLDQYLNAYKVEVKQGNRNKDDRYLRFNKPKSTHTFDVLAVVDGCSVIYTPKIEDLLNGRTGIAKQAS